MWSPRLTLMSWKIGLNRCNRTLVAEKLNWRRVPKDSKSRMMLYYQWMTPSKLSKGWSEIISLWLQRVKYARWVRTTIDWFISAGNWRRSRRGSRRAWRNKRERRRKNWSKQIKSGSLITWRVRWGSTRNSYSVRYLNWKEKFKSLKITN